MPRRCSVCSDSRRAKINAALTDGRTLRDVAGQFRIPVSSLHRHATRHLGRQLAEVEAHGGGTLLDRVAKLSRESARLGKKAEKAGDLRTALAAVSEMTRLAGLVGRLTGELREGSGVNAAVNVAVGIKVGADATALDVAIAALDRMGEEEALDLRGRINDRFPAPELTKLDLARMVEMLMADPEVAALLPKPSEHAGELVEASGDGSDETSPGGIPT
jgi:hypothetical protein